MLRVVVVDDEILEQMAICRIINTSGLPVEIVGVASNGLEAAELARQLHPDAMLVDIKMPSISGLELIRRVKQADPAVKFVTITAYDLFDYAQEAVELGVVEYLLKPARSQDIIRVLQRLLQLLEEEQEKEREDQLLRKQLQKMLPYIRSSFMLDLMQGDAEVAALEERAAFLGFSLTPSVGMIVDIDKFSALSENMNETKRQLAKKAVFEAVNQGVGDSALLSLPLTRDRIVMLVRAPAQPELAKSSSMRLAEQVRLGVQNNTMYSCLIGVGRYCTRTQDIALSFRDANDSIAMSKVFLGGNRAVHTDDLSALLARNDWGGFSEAESQLARQLEQGESVAIQQALGELRRSLGHELTASQLSRVRLCESLLRLVRAVEAAGADQEVLAAIASEGMTALGGVDQARQSEVYLDSCRRLAELAGDELPTPGRMEIVTKAVAYLNENYAKDISLEEVARLIPLNPYYFSRLFKREMGVNFIDYLTGLRIYQAKNLLTHTDMTMAEIAEAVGYRDANYFSRVFSRTVGMPPRNYRMQRSV